MGINHEVPRTGPTGQSTKFLYSSLGKVPSADKCQGVLMEYQGALKCLCSECHDVLFS